MSVGEMLEFLFYVTIRLAEQRTRKKCGKIKSEVRPNHKCLDLDRYEFDLFSYEYSENTGQDVKAKALILQT
jgi:hypothetical protein